MKQIIQIGDSVKVKANIQDPDFWDLHMDGWQGRVVERMYSEEESVSIVGIEWDAVTLRSMPDTYLKNCIKLGSDYFGIYLRENDTELAPPRDTLDELLSVQQEFYHKFGVGNLEWAANRWLDLGEQGLRIRKVLGTAATGEREQEYEAWYQYFQKSLPFPFVTKPLDWLNPYIAPKQNWVVLGITEIDTQRHGLIMTTSFCGTLRQHPLFNLTVADPNTQIYQMVEDYKVWFINRLL